MAQTNATGLSAARRDFLRRFFHDLATPLSAVSLHLEGADRRVRRGGDPSEALTIARSELAKAFDLFDLGREFLLSETRPAEAIDFDDVVRRAAGEHAGVRVEGATEAKVYTDPQAFSIALAALLVNAVEASGADAVTVRVDRKGERVRAFIENPGELPPGDPEALFSPKNSRPGRTWGMGLARARVLADDAGGAVRLEQRDGQVVATIDLPEVTA